MTTRTRILTGITTTGTPHLGNYAGAIRPAILASRDSNRCTTDLQHGGSRLVFDVHPITDCICSYRTLATIGEQFHATASSAPAYRLSGS